MPIKLEAIISAYPAEKQKSDSLWAKILIRRLSFYVAWLAIRLGLSAFSVSVISLMLPLSAMIFWFNSQALIAILLLNMWLLLDCVDGNIARVMGGTKMGDFVDATSGYMMVGFSYFGIGVYLDINSVSWFGLSSPWFIIIGASTSILNLLARVYYQKYVNVLNKSESSEKTEIVNSNSLIKTIDHNINIGGFFTPVLLIAHLFGLLAPMLIFYGIYTTGYFSGITVILLSRSKKIDGINHVQ